MNKSRYGSYPIKGYYLLPKNPVANYHGIDRDPFEPSILDEDVEQMNFIPQQEWRRKAYEIFYANSVNVDDEFIYAIESIQAAIEIRELIEPYRGPHDIVFCEIWRLDMVRRILSSEKLGFMGYDVAYPGGDYYSAILNGFLYYSEEESLSEFKKMLNEFGLFNTPKVIPDYIRHFKNLITSEKNSTFVIYGLCKQDV